MGTGKEVRYHPWIVHVTGRMSPVYNYFFFLISQKEKIRKQNEIPIYMNIGSNYYFVVVCLFAKAGQRSEYFANAVISRNVRLLRSGLCTSEMLTLGEKTGKNHHLG